MAMETQSGATGLLIGDEVGEFRVTEFGPNRLVLSAPQVIPVLCLIVGIAAATGAVAAFLHDSGKLPGILIAVAFGTLWQAKQDLGVSYTIDGTAREIVKRQFLSTKRWAAVDLQGICLAVAPQASYETLRLELITADSTAVKITCRVTKAKSANKIAAAGTAMAEILALPLLGAGQSREASAETKHMLGEMQAYPSHGDNVDLRINCPHCAKRDVAAVAHVQHEQQGLLSWDTNWVRCSACGTDLHSKVSVEKLTGLSIDELERVLVYRVSFLSRLLPILAIALAIVPVIGLVVSAVSLALNFKRRGWLRTCSIAGVIISLIATAIAFLSN